MNRYSILVVDDEVDLCEILQFNLENEGYKVDVAFSAEEALMLDIQSYNLLLLDVMMREMSGFKMASILRKNPRTARTPIVFITSKDAENDRLTGFALGADDYITKPFSIRELMARIKAILKHLDVKEYRPIDIVFGELVMSLSNKKVFLNKVEITFTKKEFEILRFFLENKNQVFTREEIITQVWLNDESILSRTIDVNINRLRSKIGMYNKHIVTCPGFGYCFES